MPFPLTRDQGRAKHVPKVRSNKARTRTANGRELGLTPCGELAGVVAKTLMCRGSVHGSNIVDRSRNVNIGSVGLNSLDPDRGNTRLMMRAGPLWRLSLDERDVGPHRVSSMFRPGLLPPLICADPIFQSLVGERL